ncbi:MAG: sigma-70 family RNA polymerase sigma factor, partial [Pirellulaceae bacterium]
CEQTDEELAKAIADDHPNEAAKEAFRQLRDRYAPLVHRFLLARVQSNVAADIHQETWIRVWNKSHLFDGRNAKAWILTIARNVTLDHHRKLKRRPEQSLPEKGYLDPADHSSPMESMIDEEERLALAGCLEVLEQRSRQIVCDRLQGLNYEEIAEQLEITVENARKILFRSKEQLTDCVQQKLQR